MTLLRAWFHKNSNVKPLLPDEERIALSMTQTFQDIEDGKKLREQAERKVLWNNEHSS